MPHKIYHAEFNKLLHQIPSLSQKERDHLKKVFDNDLVNGLDSYELKHKIDSLHFSEEGYGTEGYLDQSELNAVKQKLLQHMG